MLRELTSLLWFIRSTSLSGLNNEELAHKFKSSISFSATMLANEDRKVTNWFQSSSNNAANIKYSIISIIFFFLNGCKDLRLIFFISTSNNCSTSFQQNEHYRIIAMTFYLCTGPRHLKNSFFRLAKNEGVRPFEQCWLSSFQNSILIAYTVRVIIRESYIMRIRNKVIN